MALRTLYGRINSANVQKVAWTFHELGLDYTRIDAGSPHELNGSNPKYLELNPNGLVPTLDDGGFILWESHAIVRYLASRYGSSTPLYPQDVKQRALADQWLDWGTTITNEVGTIFRGLIRTPPEKRDNAAIEAAIKKADQLFKILDGALAKSGGDFILGEHLSVADIIVAPSAFRWFNLKIERSEVPHVEKWYKRLQENEGFQKIVVQDLS